MYWVGFVQSTTGDIIRPVCSHRKRSVAVCCLDVSLSKFILKKKFKTGQNIILNGTGTGTCIISIYPKQKQVLHVQSVQSTINTNRLHNISDDLQQHSLTQTDFYLNVKNLSGLLLYYCVVCLFATSCSVFPWLWLSRSWNIRLFTINPLKRCWASKQI